MLQIGCSKNNIIMYVLLLCIPPAVENYGAWGPGALRAFLQVVSCLAIHDNTPKLMVVAELRGHLSLSLIRANT